MDSKQFQERCIEIIKDYVNDRLDKTDNIEINESNIFTVWLTKVLQNNKALLSTTLPDGMYYEITYNGDKDEFYLDAYKKVENVLIK